jgi:hypothetical protein
MAFAARGEGQTEQVCDKRGEARHGIVTCTLVGEAGATVSATPEPDS